MTPLNLEVLINPTLSDGVPNGSTRANCLLGGHADFDSGNPGLMEDLSRRVLIVKMLPASFGPEEVKDEVVEDVERLFGVGEAPNVVSLEARWVILTLENSFAQHDEGLGGGDLARHPPFFLNAFEGLPSEFGEGAFEKAMLGGLQDPNATYLVGGGDPHTLEPSFDKQVAVEG